MFVFSHVYETVSCSRSYILRMFDPTATGRRWHNQRHMIQLCITIVPKYAPHFCGEDETLLLCCTVSIYLMHDSELSRGWLGTAHESLVVQRLQRALLTLILWNGTSAAGVMYAQGTNAIDLSPHEMSPTHVGVLESGHSPQIETSVSVIHTIGRVWTSYLYLTLLKSW